MREEEEGLGENERWRRGIDDGQRDEERSLATLLLEGSKQQRIFFPKCYAIFMQKGKRGSKEEKSTFSPNFST